ncbi:hypothetical protein OG756_23355 [Streptomyces sp. NBC_01310]|uniref:hypothetical protein n=1 Tax=Streptomyces sp. NBC_01310 TaxID=2903820 RepID=UPI0035B6436F|nr:hypothetical protein OG756_23355 [Streptomyces sp. NBC_01310]
MNTAVLTRVCVGAAGAALLMGGLTACGGGNAGTGDEGKTDGGKTAQAGQTPADAVKASYLKTVPAKFATMDMTITGSSGKPERITGTKGWYPATTAIRDQAEGRGDQILIGDDIYTHSDKPVQGKSWMKMNLNKDGTPRHRLNDDPAEYLALLLGQDKLALVGAEQPDGVEARHFKGSFTNADLVKADEATKVMEAANRQHLREAVKDVTSLEVDLWIGKDGYPVRVDTVRTIGDGTTTVSAKFSGYGTAQPVVAPPADQVADFDAVMKGIEESRKETERTLEEADQTLKDAGLGGLKRS